MSGTAPPKSRIPSGSGRDDIPPPSKQHREGTIPERVTSGNLPETRFGVDPIVNPPETVPFAPGVHPPMARPAPASLLAAPLERNLRRLPAAPKADDPVQDEGAGSERGGLDPGGGPVAPACRSFTRRAGTPAPPSGLPAPPMAGAGTPAPFSEPLFQESGAGVPARRIPTALLSGDAVSADRLLSGKVRSNSPSRSTSMAATFSPASGRVVIGVAPVTAVAIEHNFDVLGTADRLRDLGPEGGDAGGRILARGPPRSVAEVEARETGLFSRRARNPHRDEWRTGSGHPQTGGQVRPRARNP